MPTLLLVEDNLHIRRIFQDKLQREGFRVTTADDGAAGLERAAETHPDRDLARHHAAEAGRIPSAHETP